MIVLQDPFISKVHECPYIKGRECRYEYFFAMDLSGEELNDLLEKGWRKFGVYFFKPNCIDCSQCVPVRVRAFDFMESKNQKKIRKKGRNVRVHFGPLDFRQRIYDIYQDHSRERFGREVDLEEFLSSFYTPSCPSLQSEYYDENDELIAVGFLDHSTHALSSAYFVFDTAYSRLRLGTLSILYEIDYARSLGLDYYYLGYWVKENQSMAYKNRFYPHEQYDWDKKEWIYVEKT